MIDQQIERLDGKRFILNEEVEERLVNSMRELTEELSNMKGVKPGVS